MRILILKTESSMMKLLLRMLMLSSFLFVHTKARSAPAAGDPGEEEEGGSKIDWAVILSNPQNIGILFGMLMVVLVIIYCLWKKICHCFDIIWNSFCRIPCCLTCKWCCVPCYKGTRNTIAGCKDGFYEGMYTSCDHHYHPWKKMEYVSSTDDSDVCFCC